MTFTKMEKIWLSVVILFYVAYNLPFLPSYDNPAGTILHALLTLIPLWSCVYIGLFKVSGDYDQLAELQEEKQEDPTC